MKNALLRIIHSFLVLILISCASVSADTTRPRSSKAALLKSLEINRSMLTRFEAEFQTVSKDSAGASEQQLSNIRYKIKALDEENQKMTQALPETMQANEFLKDMLARSNAEKKVAMERMDTTMATPEDLIFPTTAPQFSVEEIALPAPSGRPNNSNRTPKIILPEEKDNPDTLKLHERALEFVSKKELKKAINLYEEIVLINPNDDEAYLIMGHCLVLTGQYEKAEENFQNSVHINGVNVDQIAPFYENLVLQTPNDPEAYSHLGFVCLMLGNLKRADEAFKEALALNPQSADALRGINILENHPR